MSLSAEVWPRSCNAKMFPVRNRKESRHWPLWTLLMIKKEELRITLEDKVQSKGVWRHTRMSAWHWSEESLPHFSTQNSWNWDVWGASCMYSLFQVTPQLWALTQPFQDSSFYSFSASPWWIYWHGLWTLWCLGQTCAHFWCPDNSNQIQHKSREHYSKS